MPKNVKLNRRSVGTQSDLQVGVSDEHSGGRKTNGRNQFEVNGKFSSLCKKSAYRNLLQRSITVDAHSKVNFALDFIERSRGTQTILTDETELSEEDSNRIHQEESLKLAIPTPARSQEISIGSSLLSYESGHEFRLVKVHYEEKPGTSSFDSSSLQIEDRNYSIDGGSLAMLYSTEDLESLQSTIFPILRTFENQPSLRGQSNEAVLLVQDYQSYDIMNTARRTENVSPIPQKFRKFRWKLSKRHKNNDAARPIAIFPDASVQTIFVCRICHEGEDVEPLIRPCLCKGSVGYIHVKCLKIWLEQSNLSRCEICGYPYTIRQLRKYTKYNSIIVFIRSIVDRRALMYDVISFIAVTPLCIIGIIMCVRASVISRSANPIPGSNFQMGNVTRAGMIMLTTTIVVAYGVWLYTLLSYHYKSWKRWYNSCYEVEVIPVNLTSQERLETMQRLEEERRRRPRTNVEELATIADANSSHHLYANFFQRRPFAAGRVQSLPQ